MFLLGTLRTVTTHQWNFHPRSPPTDIWKHIIVHQYPRRTACFPYIVVIEKNCVKCSVSKKMWLVATKVTTGCILPIGYSLPWFKLRYLKNLRSFSIKGKDLFEPLVLRTKAAKILLFLKAFPWVTDLTLGDFRVKKPAKLGREICI